MSKKKVVIFYSKTGGGHLSAAEALAEEIRSREGFSVTMYDGLEKTSLGHATYPNPQFGFFLLSHYTLPLFNFLYAVTDTTLGLWALRAFIKMFWGGNFKRVIEEELPDFIITTHHFISPSTIPAFHKIPFYTVVADLGKPHRIWFDKSADKIIVPTSEMADWAKNKFLLNPNRIKAVSFPVRNGFTQVKKISLTDQILILGAGLKTSRVKEWISQIKKELPKKKIAVVCGQNIALKMSLSNIDGIQSFGFIKNLDDILKNSDLVISKAGPGAIMEAASLKKPIIITTYVGMQEKGNVDFVISNNLGISDEDGENIISSIKNVYKNYKKYARNGEIISADTAEIVDQLLN